MHIPHAVPSASGDDFEVQWDGLGDGGTILSPALHFSTMVA